ncbi:MAG: S8 family serine peptidase, partial [Pseudomonadota bacterium]
RVRALPSGATTDFNHFYRASQATGTPEPDVAVCEGLHCGGHQMVNWPAQSARLDTCLGDVAIGMIDTGLNEDHETFDGARLTVHRLSFDKLEPSRAIHGTAVAAVLIGSPKSRSPGLLPGVKLFAVDVFHRAGSDERSDVYSLLEGLSYLAEQNVDVINLSLAGPDNVLLERALADLSGIGVISVAATGNAGSKATPQYPAAYEDVIAVTAVDRNARVYRRAVRGEHVDFSAPGVDVWTAASIKGARPKSGTSFAAPFVTGAVALLVSETEGLTPADVRSRLVETVQDLGPEGHDPTYGHGLISLLGACEG